MGNPIHHKLSYSLLLVTALIAFSTCKKKLKDQTLVPVEELIPGLNPEKLADLIIEKSRDETYKPRGIYDWRFGDTLKWFYVQRSGRPIWLSYLKDTSVRNHLTYILNSSEAHGLNSKFYNGKLIKLKLSSFDSLKYIRTDADYNLLADLDYLISMSVLSIYKDLALGRVDPYRFYKPFFELSLTKVLGFNLLGILNEPLSFQDSIILKSPSSVHYHKLQLLYQRYAKYSARQQEYDTSQSAESEHNSKVINQRLLQIWKSDNGGEESWYQKISEQREHYIQKTRQLYGLPKGSIDSLFIETICGPSSRLSDNLMVCLERERWFSKPDTGQFVYVNLCEFVVSMHSDSIKTMRVCVGKSKASNYDERYKEYLKTKNARAKPINSETPVIASRIKEVVVNPTWTVPNSIIGKEMYHHIVNNPNYLSRKGFEVVKDGKVVPASSINWKKFSPYGVKVKIRQKSGDGNSLGKLKFNFPNGHNIYMHDTPEKGKFYQANRAVSHGCVRLQYPVQMAEFLLKLQNDSLLVDKFRIKMGLQPYDTALQMADSLLKPIKNTEIIKLKNTIPVYIDYKTVNFEQDGSISFYKDIYRKNEALAKKLKN